MLVTIQQAPPVISINKILSVRYVRATNGVVDKVFPVLVRRLRVEGLD